jgi:hypothetical protein
MNSDRRQFLKSVGGVATALAASQALAQTAGAQEVLVASGTQNRSGRVTRRCLLELDGFLCGWLWFAEGGSATATVVEDPPGPDGLVDKRLGPVTHDDLVLYCGADLSKRFYDWIQDTANRRAQRRSGAIIYLDAQAREVSRLVFTNALPIEIGFPALDAMVQDVAMLMVRLVPQSTRLSSDGAGKPFNVAVRDDGEWLGCNFRLGIDGLADAAGQALCVEPVVIRHDPLRDVNGAPLDPAKGTARFDVSNLAVALPAAAAKSFQAWFEESVGDIADPEAAERNGRLDYLAADSSRVLFSISLEGLGLFKLETVFYDTGQRSVPLTLARMYCENARLEHHIARP